MCRIAQNCGTRFMLNAIDDFLLIISASNTAV